MDTKMLDMNKKQFHVMTINLKPYHDNKTRTFLTTTMILLIKISIMLKNNNMVWTYKMSRDALWLLILAYYGFINEIIMQVDLMLILIDIIMVSLLERREYV